MGYELKEYAVKPVVFPLLSPLLPPLPIYAVSR